MSMHADAEHFSSRSPSRTPSQRPIAAGAGAIAGASASADAKSEEEDAYEDESTDTYELEASPGPPTSREQPDSNSDAKLRPYQELSMKMLAEAIASGKRAPLLVLPTGSGKTIVAARLMQQAAAKGKRVLFLAPRRELVWQTSSKLGTQMHGIVLSGALNQINTYAPIQVASIDTLRSRIKQNRLSSMSFSLIFIDEAHLGITKSFVALLDRWPNAIRIGLTATPTRKDGKALGIIYDTLIEPTTVAELTTLGYLAPAKYFSISAPDLARVGTVAGDFNPGQLEREMNKPKLVGDIVEHWLAHAPTRRTVVFATSIAHSVALRDAFLRTGVAAEHVDANTPMQMREATISRIRSGQTQVLCNCFLASYGFDLPPLSCIVLARPTKSLQLYLQMIGRGLRVAEMKDDCLILDHSGAVHMHGFVADEREWTLNGSSALVAREPSHRERHNAALMVCSECAYTFNGTRICPNCGYPIQPRGKDIETMDGKLVEMGIPHQSKELQRATFHAELLSMALERGYKPGWVAYKFKERFLSWPPTEWATHQPVSPTTATRRWIKSRNIASARRRHAEEER